MNVTTRLATFGIALAAVLGIGAGLGAAIGPDVTRAEPEAPAPIGEGVVATAEGYRLIAFSTTLDAHGGPFRFAIEDQEGERVREYTPIHERDLHLIVVNRELTVFHHVHPTLTDGGIWTIDLPAIDPGSYRAVADFQVADGPRLALGIDLSVAGVYQPGRLPDPTTVTTVDGYEVTLTTARGKGAAVTATLTVRRDGVLVTNLEPYLGANGHLIAMRAGDLAYAHVHPIEDDDSDARAGLVRFNAELASAGRYGFFFDFQHNGTVHTASFTFDQGAVTGAAPMEH
jgi:hypothetical protein